MIGGVTKKAAREWLDDMQAIHRMLVLEKVDPFSDNSPEAKRARIERAEHDDEFFCTTYLPQYFEDSFCIVHDELFDWSNQRDGFFGTMVAPKEHGKSISLMGKMVKNGCYGHRHFHTLTSETEVQAIAHLTPIRINFEENPRILADFGHLKRDGFWDESEFVLTSNVKYLARGINQPHTGLLFFQYRPDFMRLDDVESRLNTRNPQICKDRLDRIRGEIYGALDRDGCLIWVSNWNRNHSAVALITKEAADNPEISSRVYRATLKNGKPLWPEHWTLKKLAKRKKVMGTIAYELQMMNRDVAEGSEFPEEHLTYYKLSEIKNKRGRRVAYGDPAHKARRQGHSDYAWVVGEWIDGILYVRHAFIKKVTFPAWVSHWFTLYKDFPCRGYFEGVGAQHNYQYAFSDQSAKLGLPAPLPRSEIDNKEERVVERLAGLWEAGRIRFLKGDSNQDKLVEQCLYWGEPGVGKDGPDALAGAAKHLQFSGGMIADISPDGEDYEDEEWE